MKTNLYAYWRLMRFDKPIGIFLLLWPTLWAVWIAGNGHPSMKILIIFILGVVLMRAAGCIINDVADRNFDSHVTRTKSRPLVTKEVSIKEAITLTVILCLLSFILVLQLNIKTISLATLALALSTLYPFTKRWTYLPQLVLGASWYIGLLMAFSAQQNQIPFIAYLLYITVVLWTVAYDTLYAMVDREDDVKIGIKSTAILFGQWDRLWVGILQLLVILLLTALGHSIQASWSYYVAILAASLLFIYQQWLIRQRESSFCLKAFLNNNYVGLVLFIGILLIH